MTNPIKRAAHALLRRLARHIADELSREAEARLRSAAHSTVQKGALTVTAHTTELPGGFTVRAVVLPDGSGVRFINSTGQESA